MSKNYTVKEESPVQCKLGQALVALNKALNTTLVASDWTLGVFKDTGNQAWCLHYSPGRYMVYAVPQEVLYEKDVQWVNKYLRQPVVEGQPIRANETIEQLPVRLPKESKRASKPKPAGYTQFAY